MGVNSAAVTAFPLDGKVFVDGRAVAAFFGVPAQA
jgi:hypothetical protein